MFNKISLWLLQNGPFHYHDFKPTGRKEILLLHTGPIKVVEYRCPICGKHKWVIRN